MVLTINKEFRKGILFVRLLGVLNEDTVEYLNKEITLLVKDMIITNVVINIKELNKIDIAGINEIMNIYNYCKSNNGVSLICGSNKNIEDKISNSKVNSIAKINNELKAIELLKNNI